MAGSKSGDDKSGYAQRVTEYVASKMPESRGFISNKLREEVSEYENYIPTPEERTGSTCFEYNSFVSYDL